MNCHCCNGPTKKAGKFENKNRIVQRFQCVKCNKTFSEAQPLQGVRIEDSTVAQIVSLLAEGMGINSICRILGANKQTVLNVLLSVGDKCQALLNAKVRNIQPENVEVDELYSYVGRRPDFTDTGDPERGEFYCYLALDRETKLIVSHLIGKRASATTLDFLQDLKQRATNDFQLSTDGFYAGRKSAVFRVFRNTIHHGSEIKEFGKARSMIVNNRQRSQRKFNPDVCLWVKRQAHIGSPDLKTVNTSRVERLNLSVRLFNRRYTRCTLGYSKTVDHHKAATAIFVAFYNFCRTHSAHKQTPAQASGLTGHKWTALELVLATI